MTKLAWTVLFISLAVVASGHKNDVEERLVRAAFPEPEAEAEPSHRTIRSPQPEPEPEPESDHSVDRDGKGAERKDPQTTTDSYDYLDGVAELFAEERRRRKREAAKQEPKTTTDSYDYLEGVPELFEEDRSKREAAEQEPQTTTDSYDYLEGVPELFKDRSKRGCDDYGDYYGDDYGGDSKPIFKRASESFKDRSKRGCDDYGGYFRRDPESEDRSKRAAYLVRDIDGGARKYDHTCCPIRDMYGRYTPGSLKYCRQTCARGFCPGECECGSGCDDFSDGTEVVYDVDQPDVELGKQILKKIKEDPNWIRNNRGTILRYRTKERSKRGSELDSRAYPCDENREDSLNCKLFSRYHEKTGPRSETCLERKYFCDNKEDCPDGYDEFRCKSTTNPSRASRCNPETCKLPTCYCSEDGRATPKSEGRETPQMIMLTFDDAVTHTPTTGPEELHFQRQATGVERFLDQILDPALKNPNGCSIKGTLFAQHLYTDYAVVNKFFNLGHEIGTHGVTHENDPSYWRDLSVEGWEDEMIGAKLILSRFANISLNEIRGMRVPGLNHNGNNMMQMMTHPDGFVYDSSHGAKYGDMVNNPEPFWPYTLDHRQPHSCVRDEYSEPYLCPTRSFPGIWEIPINLKNMDLLNFDENKPEEIKLVMPDSVHPGCDMLDACHSNFYNVTTIGKFLNQVLYRSYFGNRAPVGLFLHAATFKSNPQLIEPFKQWMAHTLETFPDVYFVRMNDVIEWMQAPEAVTGKDAVKDFAPWKVRCNPTEDRATPERRACSPISPCRYADQTPERNMRICGKCPENYPWMEYFREDKELGAKAKRIAGLAP